MIGHRLRIRAALAALGMVAFGAPLVAQFVPLPDRMPPAESQEIFTAAPAGVEPPPVGGPGQPWMLVEPQPDPLDGFNEPWTWQILPPTSIYRSYLAGVKEPRVGGLLAREKDRGGFIDGEAGARVGVLRFGSRDELFPQGYQLDMETAAFLRFDSEEHLDMDSADYRLGVPLTYGFGRWQTKLGWYHLSAHAGDEFLLKHPTFDRINYSRDVIVYGLSYYPSDDWRVYAEAGFAYHVDGGSEPWELQFGVDYSPAYAVGPLGAPFVAVNGHLREEVNFGGEFVAQAGWQWRGRPGGRLLRVGAQYFNGQNDQYQFFRTSEQSFGGGIWYDY